MQFSFIIPTYNYASRLPDTLNSVLNQTEHDYEIIVVDDGSSDNTEEVIKPYLKNKNIHYLKQSNQGPAAARNNGIKQAQGNYIYPLDADDQLLPNALTIMRTAIEQNPKAELIIAQPAHKIVCKPCQLNQSKQQNFINYLRKRFSVAHGSTVIKRSLFNNLNYPANLRGREDIAFFAQALAQANTISIPETVVTICKHPDSYRHQLEQHQGDLQLAEYLFDPKKLPAELLCYKDEFISQLCLSIFRSHYRAGHYATAKKWYWRAIKKSPRRLLQWSYLSKFLRSLIKS